MRYQCNDTTLIVDTAKTNPVLVYKLKFHFIFPLVQIGNLVQLFFSYSFNKILQKNRVKINFVKGSARNSS